MSVEIKLRSPLLLIVCTGNVCRSPMVEAQFIHYMKMAGLAGTVISRGLAAPVGRPPHPYAREVAAARGVPIAPEKRAASVTSAEMAAATAIFVMEGSHRLEIQRKYPTASGKTFLVGQWESNEIPDPINMDISAFESAWSLGEAGVQSWIGKLESAGVLSHDAA